jgi:hypothetical protein
MSDVINERDIVSNSLYDCKYGIVTEITNISMYSRVYGVETLNGKFFWDDSDARYCHTLSVGDKLLNPHENYIAQIVEMRDDRYTLLIDSGKSSWSSISVARHFDLESAKSLSSNKTYSSTKCAHNFKPWPMDIFRAYCKYCGEPSPNN